MQMQMETMDGVLDELRGDLLNAREHASDLENALHDSETKRYILTCSVRHSTFYALPGIHHGDACKKAVSVAK